jgi:hypothetical protein
MRTTKFLQRACYYTHKASHDSAALTIVWIVSSNCHADKKGHKHLFHNVEPCSDHYESNHTIAAHPTTDVEDTECTSERVGKNGRFQRVCLNRHRVRRFARSVGFYPRAASYILRDVLTRGA